VICLENYYFPGRLEQAIANFVDHYNKHCYNEALRNLRPADVSFGRAIAMEDARAATKRITWALCRRQHLLAQVSA
jgi:putative transposase